MMGNEEEEQEQAGPAIEEEQTRQTHLQLIVRWKEADQAPGTHLQLMVVKRSQPGSDLCRGPARG